MVDSNSTGGHGGPPLVTYGCCVLLDRGHSDRLIPNPEESYQVWCVCTIIRHQQWGSLGLCRSIAPWEKEIFLFYIYIHIHTYTWVCASWIEFNNSPTRCDLFNLLHFCWQLYMFQVLTPIIRSLYNCNYSFWYWLTAINKIRCY